MKLQKCDHCNASFTWSEINKSLWLAYRPITCRQCGTKHKVLVASRFLFVLIVVPMTPLGLYVVNTYNPPILSLIVMLLLLTIPLLLIFPYLARYSDDY
ncbi:TIGR04104 family putative zinc finger protein [Sporosarcina beigongshangi]|uniref:TIGR04104 family putative zinc finger protein n=1 Tax=Sporosarcina beigongshangi TaxID=2782538 RepID=UPI001939C0FF